MSNQGNGFWGRFSKTVSKFILVMIILGIVIDVAKKIKQELEE